MHLVVALSIQTHYYIHFFFSFITQTHKNKTKNLNNKLKLVSDSKKQFETHHITVRWGVYCPFGRSVSTELDGRVEINMFGLNGSNTQLHNPVNRLVYQRPNTDMQDESSSRAASGKITFDIRRGNNVIRSKKLPHLSWKYTSLFEFITF